MSNPLLVSGNVWSPDPEGIVNLAYTDAGTDRVELPAGTKAFRLYVSTSCYYRLGNGKVTVSAAGSDKGSFLPGGAVEEAIAASGHTHIAIVRDAADGTEMVRKALAEVAQLKSEDKDEGKKQSGPCLK